MKISISDLLGQFASIVALNSKFQQIEDELNDKVLYRDNPGTEPNEMNNDLDMNNNPIINLPPASDPTSPLRLIDVEDIIAGEVTLHSTLLGLSGDDHPHYFMDGRNMDAGQVSDGTDEDDLGDVIERRQVVLDDLAALYEGDWTRYSYLETKVFSSAVGEGGARWIKTGTGGTPTTAGTIYTNGLNSGFVVDQAGNIWSFDPRQIRVPEMFGAVGDDSTDDEDAIVSGLTAGPLFLSPGKTYYASNPSLPSGSMLFFNGSTMRGGLRGGDSYKLIGPGTVKSNEGDGRPFTGHNSANHFCQDIVYRYSGTTEVEAVVYFAPDTHLVENVKMVRPEIYCDTPAVNANTRGLKFFNREAFSGRCQELRIEKPYIHDVPSMALEIVSEWTYNGATLGHQDVLVTAPTFDNWGQTTGSDSKIGMSLAGWGRAKVVDPTFKNANGKNWELVSQNGSEVLDCIIEDTASGFDIFSTSAPGAAPSAVNVKCRIDGVRVLDGNTQLMQVAGFEDGEIANIETTDSSRLDLGCFRTRVHDNIVRCSSTGNIAIRVTGGNNEIYDNSYDISAIGAGGATALRFTGASAVDNIARNNKLITHSSVSAWDETGGAADNLVLTYFDADDIIHDTRYIPVQMAADADEDLSKSAQHADILYITDNNGDPLTTTRKLTFTLGRNLDLLVTNATGSGQAIEVGYSSGSVANIPDGETAHVLGNTGGVWKAD